MYIDQGVILCLFFYVLSTLILAGLFILPLYVIPKNTV